ncbi:MAG: DUF4412 domain-containing protein [Cryomorphaceae bacterium]|nr:MAG: DUF4412 domain-containing protein [Cryomorphaceae bacterium]
MKNMMIRWSLSMVALGFVFNLNAQSFEGVITYKITYENLPEEMAPYASMLPSQSITTMKGEMTKLEQPLSMGMKQTTIMDNAAETGVMLMDMMGQKMAVVLDQESRKEMRGEDDVPDFEYVNETKNIAGYDCKKAIMRVEEDGQEIVLEIYYTDKLTSSKNSSLPGLKGFPLKYSTSTGQFIMTLEAESVEKRKVSEDEFSIPDGYTHMDFNEFQKTMGAMGGE